MDFHGKVFHGAGKSNIIMASMRMNQIRLLQATALLILLAVSAAILPVGAKSAETINRPANFIFLVDVSGSIVSPKTMVKMPDGTTITLFECLRQALVQIVKDERLIGPSSKVAFITFGTAITEKSAWPNKLENAADRHVLLQKIESPTELQADKHGDTYMAGALDRAYATAARLAAQSDPCTTNLIVMLTDGWDEPPHGATVQLNQVAQKFLAKQKELKAKLGVNTWQLRVIGLQRLPDRKVGTTTAKQLADMLGGGFLDVGEQGSGSVAQNIYLALRKTFQDLRGTIEIPQATSGGWCDFKGAESGQESVATLPIRTRSCWDETITRLTDVSPKLSSQQAEQLLNTYGELIRAGKLTDTNAAQRPQLASRLSPAQLAIKLGKSQYLISPNIQDAGSSTNQTIEAVAHVGSACPPGTYVGTIRLDSTARTPDFIPYSIFVPSRIVAEPENVEATVRKPGFFFPEPCQTTVAFKVFPKTVSHISSTCRVRVVPQEGKLTTAASAASEKSTTINQKQFNQGKSVDITLDRKDGNAVSMVVDIPANQAPGTYEGQLKLEVLEPPNAIAPSAVSYKVHVQPSAWEEVSPVAIPIFAILVILAAIALLLIFRNLRS